MTSSAMPLIFMLLRGTLGQNHDGGDKFSQLNLDLIALNRGVEDRANERTKKRKKVTTAGFQQHKCPFEGFPECLDKDICPHPYSHLFHIRLPIIR